MSRKAFVLEISFKTWHLLLSVAVHWILWNHNPHFSDTQALFFFVRYSWLLYKSAWSIARPYNEEAKWNYPRKPLWATSNLSNNGYVTRERINIKHCTERTLEQSIYAFLLWNLTTVRYWKALILAPHYSRHTVVTTMLKIAKQFSITTCFICS